MTTTTSTSIDHAIEQGYLLINTHRWTNRRHDYYARTSNRHLPRIICTITRHNAFVEMSLEPLWPRQLPEAVMAEVWEHARTLLHQARSRRAEISGGTGLYASYLNPEDGEPFAQLLAEQTRRHLAEWIGKPPVWDWNDAA